MRPAFSHSKHCFTCNKQRPRKNLGYDLETLKTYCNDSDCFQGELIPLEGETVREALYERYDKLFVDTLDRMLGKPLSTRLQPYLAMHLLKTAEVNELSSFNEALLFILNDHFDRSEITGYTLPEWKEYPEEEEEITYTTILEDVPVIKVEEIEEEVERPKNFEIIRPVIDNEPPTIEDVDPDPEEPEEEEEWII